MQEQQYKITFKNNGGRTGNLIFEYMLCKLIELKYGHKYEAYSLENENEKFFLITDENIETIIPENVLNINIICSGYFQKSRFFVKYRLELIEIMKEAKEDYWILNNKKYYICDFFNGNPRFDITEKDVVISLRLDDFIQYPCETSDIIPPEYYLNILNNLEMEMEIERLYIVCDKVNHDWEYEYLEMFQKWNPIYVIGDTLLRDGALMRDSPIFIHSNSTFSWLMSFFSQIPNKKRYIPCTKMYKGQELNIIDTNDIFIEVKPLTHEEVHHIQGTRKRVK